MKLKRTVKTVKAMIECARIAGCAIDVCVRVSSNPSNISLLSESFSASSTSSMTLRACRVNVRSRITRWRHSIYLWVLCTKSLEFRSHKIKLYYLCHAGILRPLTRKENGHCCRIWTFSRPMCNESGAQFHLFTISPHVRCPSGTVHNDVMEVEEEDKVEEIKIEGILVIKNEEGEAVRKRKRRNVSWAPPDGLRQERPISTDSLSVAARRAPVERSRRYFSGELISSK